MQAEAEAMLASAWRRPEGVALPSVWKRFEGPLAMPDGRKPNFWIQDVTPDFDEGVVDFMSNNFLQEENFCSMSGVREDPVSLEEIRFIWKLMLQQRAALVALTDWPDGPDHPRIAGCNVTYVTLPGQHMGEDVRGSKLKKVLGALHHVEAGVDVYALYGVDAILDALGLSVSPEFRGQGLGLQLLLARDDLCRAVGLRLTISVFTGIASQKQSARAGFEVVSEQRYDEYRDEEGNLIFPQIPCDVFQLKAKRID